MALGLEFTSRPTGPLGLGLGALDWDGADAFDGHEPNWDDDDELASDDVADTEEFEAVEEVEEVEGGEDKELEVEVEVEEAEAHELEVEEGWQEQSSDFSVGPVGTAHAHNYDGTHSFGGPSRTIRPSASLEELTNLGIRRRNLRPRTKPALSFNPGPVALVTTHAPARPARSMNKGKGKAIPKASSSHPRTVKSGSRKRYHESDDESENNDPSYEPTASGDSHAGPVPKRLRTEGQVKRSKASGTPMKNILPSLKDPKTGMYRCPFYLDSGSYSPAERCIEWAKPRRDRVAQHMEQAHIEAGPDRGFINGAHTLSLLRDGKLEWVDGVGFKETNTMTSS